MSLINPLIVEGSSSSFFVFTLALSHSSSIIRMLWLDIFVCPGFNHFLTAVKIDLFFFTTSIWGLFKSLEVKFKFALEKSLMSVVSGMA